MSARMNKAVSSVFLSLVPVLALAFVLGAVACGSDNSSNTNTVADTDAPQAGDSLLPGDTDQPGDTQHGSDSVAGDDDLAGDSAGSDTDVVDVCADNPCVGNADHRSVCVLDAGELGGYRCDCDVGFADAAGLCCPANSHANGDACACDLGYVPTPLGTCLMPQGDPCELQPCAVGPIHQTVCVADDTPALYHCACDVGFEPKTLGSTFACVIALAPACTGGLVCTNDHCVPAELGSQQCVSTSDCTGGDLDSMLLCNSAAAGGVCQGCQGDLDCPGSFVCNNYGACTSECADDSDCPWGRCSTGLGICIQKTCTKDSDCPVSTLCEDEDNSGSGLCRRTPCEEVACSPTNPAGSCTEAGASCIYGACQTSCAPNPCDHELNKNACVVTAFGPECQCNAGYTLGSDGRCMPAVVSVCPAGLECQDGYCANDTDPGFVCTNDIDCGVDLTCLPTSPVGQCFGCAEAQGDNPAIECPFGYTCLAGYCMAECLSNSECGTDMACYPSGYCGRKVCESSADCSPDSACVAGSDGTASCKRIPCE